MKFIETQPRSAVKAQRTFPMSTAPSRTVNPSAVHAFSLPGTPSQVSGHGGQG